MTMNHRSIALTGCLMFAAAAFAQTAPKEAPALEKYVIERDLPGAGKLSAAELQGIARKSLDSTAPNNSSTGNGDRWLEWYPAHVRRSEDLALWRDCRGKRQYGNGRCGCLGCVLRDIRGR
jgi:hypothetical protein